MPDALVKFLNGFGYQPVFLPGQHAEPPELYAVANKRLVRWGLLSAYAPAARTLKRHREKRADLQSKATTRKKVQAAADFFKGAMACLGLPMTAGADFGFLGNSGLVFSFRDITADRVDPTDVQRLLETMPLTAFPEHLRASERLHVAYEYLFARELLITRVESGGSEGDLSAHLDEFLKAGVQARVKAESKSTLSFSADGKSAAFAYRAGLIKPGAAGWEFFPTVIVGATAGDDLERGPYLPLPGVAPTVGASETRRKSGA